MKLKNRLDKKILEILEKNERSCVNCHHCIPLGKRAKWTYVAKCDIVNKLFGFKGEKSLFALIRKYENGKYPFACKCFHYDGGP